MSLSRRHFFRNLGLGSAGLLSTPFIIGRGHEAMAFEAGAPAASRRRRLHQNQLERERPRPRQEDDGRASEHDHAAGRPRISAGLYGRPRRHDCRDLRRRPRPRHRRHRVGSHPRGGDAGVLLRAEAARHRGADLWNLRPGGAPHRRPGQDDHRRQIAGTRHRRDGRGGQGRRNGVLLQPEQPDRHGAQRGRGGEVRSPRQAELAGDADPASTRRTSTTRTTRPSRRRCRWRRSSPASSSPDRSRRRTGWRACAWATPIGQPETLKAISGAWNLGSVNTLTAAAGIASLRDAKHIEEERAENARVRDFTLQAFKSMGFEAADNHTNCIFVDLKRPAKEFRDGVRRAQGVGRARFPAVREDAQPHHARVDGRNAAGGAGLQKGADGELDERRRPLASAPSRDDPVSLMRGADDRSAPLPFRRSIRETSAQPLPNANSRPPRGGLPDEHHRVARLAGAGCPLCVPRLAALARFHHGCRDDARGRHRRQRRGLYGDERRAVQGLPPHRGKRSHPLHRHAEKWPRLLRLLS